jgi:hypothetical protein
VLEIQFYRTLPINSSRNYACTRDNPEIGVFLGFSEKKIKKPKKVAFFGVFF